MIETINKSAFGHTYRATCDGQCGAIETTHRCCGGTHIMQGALIAKGWLVGQEHHYCPSCGNRITARELVMATRVHVYTDPDYTKSMTPCIQPGCHKMTSNGKYCKICQ